MSLSTSTQWEIRAGGGSDANGGGFFNRVPGTSVDYTQQATAQLSLSDLASANSTTLTSATGGFAAAMAGNLLQITAGTNFTPGFYEVVTFTNANTVVLDRNPTSGAAASGGVGSLGGALATLAKAFSGNRAGNTFWVQKGAGVHGLTAPANPPGGGSALPTCVIGYNAARGDGDAVPDYSNCPTIQAQAGFPTSGATSGVFALTTSFVFFRNLILDANNLASRGFTFNGGSYARLDNVKAINWTGRGFELNNVGRARRCTAALGVAGATAAFYANGNGGAGQTFAECVAIGNPCPGFYIDGPAFELIDSFSIGNTGATGHGILAAATSQGSLIRGNTVAGNAGDGFNFTGYNLDFSSFARNIFANNAGMGIRSAGGANYLSVQIDADYNAFYNNAAGARAYVPAGPHDVVPTADPFVNASGGNYALNSNNPGGAQVRGLGAPAAVFGLPGTANAVSPGAVQPSAGVAAAAAGGMSKSRTIEGM